MNGLLRMSERREALRFGQSLSGFQATKQKMRLMGWAKAVLAPLIAIACLVAMAAALAPGASFAADPYGRNKTNQRTFSAPIVKPMPQVIKPLPSLSEKQRMDRNRGLRTDFNSGAVSNCRSRCGSSCQTIACSGLNTSQCLSIRQQCRLSCRSRC